MWIPLKRLFRRLGRIPDDVIKDYLHDEIFLNLDEMEDEDLGASLESLENIREKFYELTEVYGTSFSRIPFNKIKQFYEDVKRISETIRREIIENGDEYTGLEELTFQALIKNDLDGKNWEYFRKREEEELNRGSKDILEYTKPITHRN
ncbi:hypothetical protein HYW74_03285 [Candidatus Pacearchaeota archaeon]|nr:hypothetical protein [Candidatus Pacearchaeota archaeon]